MLRKSINCRPYQLLVLLIFVFGCSFVSAQAQISDPALSLAADDEKLKWGECPPFLPKGCAIAFLHGDPAKENLDIFFKVPGKSTIPLHWHTSAERMVLISGELHVTYEGQDASVLKPGMYAYGPAKRKHHAFCASAEPCILFIAFESPLDAVLAETPPDDGSDEDSPLEP